jgi:superfamily II DNA/RNA helicase
MQAKFRLLKRLLDEADEPFVVFAQSVDTVYEIKRFLGDFFIPCSIIVGGQDPAERRREKECFFEPGRIGRRALVSSSAGGEGINLQIARRLIHFDLPWNPMVLEQRIGRIHRIGTIDTVIVHTILLEGSREADIYSIASTESSEPWRKIQRIERRTSGGSSPVSPWRRCELCLAASVVMMMRSLEP